MAGQEGLDSELCGDCPFSRVKGHLGERSSHSWRLADPSKGGQALSPQTGAPTASP